MESVTELIRNRADTYGDRLAYTFLKNGESEDAQLSFADIDNRSRIVAAALQEITTIGDRILLLYSPGLDFITGFLGCLYAGLVAVPAFSPSSARPEKHLSSLSSIIKSANTRIILTTSDQASKILFLLRGLKSFQSTTILKTDRLEPSLSATWKPVPTNKDTIALLQYTSGSTSKPKGVMVSHGNILHNLDFIRERESNNTNSISVTWLPSFHDMGLLEGILSPIYGVYPQYLMAPLAFIQRPIRWLRAISNYHASISGGPNFAYDYCTQAIGEEQRAGLNLSSWRVAYNGSEPVRIETMKKFSRAFSPCGFRFNAFCPVYGLAESTALATATKCGTGPTQLAINISQTHAVACGNPDRISRILVVDPAKCRERTNGEEGEIWLAGPSVAMGYWNDPERSERVFNAFLADNDQGPFLRTGDLGYLVDGKLFITGRIKDLIILRGRKLFSQDIEYSASHAHTFIHKQGVAAFSIEVDNTEQLVLLAELDLRQVKRVVTGGKALSIPSSIDYQSIALDLVEAISREHEARVSTTLLVAPGQIARTSSGKIRRYLCRERYLTNGIDFMFRWDTATRPLVTGSASG